MAARTLAIDLDGYTDLPPGKIANIVTYLDMTAPPAAPPPAGAGFAIRRVERPRTGWYRDLYTRVGADWLWASRLAMPEAELAAILASPDVEVFALAQEGRDEGLVRDEGLGRDEGLLELDFREAGECELAFLGVAAPLIGSGAGRALIGHAIARAFARPVKRFWVHTCTLDHPAALGFYRRAGFRPWKLAVEVCDDPRLTGTLPRTAAPQVPIFDVAPLDG